MWLNLRFAYFQWMSSMLLDKGFEYVISPIGCVDYRKDNIIVRFSLVIWGGQTMWLSPDVLRYYDENLTYAGISFADVIA